MKAFVVVLMSYIALFSEPSVASVTGLTHKVLLVVAMNTEAQPIIDILGLKALPRAFSGLPMKGYKGKQGNVEIMLVMNGTDSVHHVQNIGTQAATLSTYLGIAKFHPDLIMSVGTAGGVVENGSHLTEIYFSKKVYFFNRRIPMDGYKEYGLGGYKSVDFTSIGERLGLKPGIMCSGDSFDEEDVDFRMFLKEQCTAVDMEAAAVAWVSSLTKTPMVAIKGITNFVRGEGIHREYEKNLPIVTMALANTVKEIFDIYP